MTFFDTIRGAEIEVFAESWDGDMSVGIAYGPEDVYAKTLEGEPFELTESEVEAMTIRAIVAEHDRGSDW